MDKFFLLLSLFLLVPYLLAVLIPSWKWLLGCVFIYALIAIYLYIDVIMHPNHSNPGAPFGMALLSAAGISGLLGIICRGISLFLQKKKFSVFIINVSRFIVILLMIGLLVGLFIKS